MIEVEKIWLSAYASLLGDVALQELCFGGLWISGGTASKHFKNFKSDLFLKQFFDKGRLKDILKTCLLYTSPSPRDISGSRMPSSA